jgi:hypothetical protein
MVNVAITSDVFERARAALQGAVVLIAGVLQKDRGDFNGVAKTISSTWPIEQRVVRAIHRAHPAVAQLGIEKIAVLQCCLNHAQIIL